VGDLHTRSTSDQNAIDLRVIVAEVNQSFADSISFVFLPGDNADHGDVPAYGVVRDALDQLRVPWCAIVGDHDVEQKSFDNFKAFMSRDTHYAFTVGNVRFFALNAFDLPEPPSFTVGDEQLKWLEDQLLAATREGLAKVLLLHCYPSDLKKGGQELVRLISEHRVKLIDMGHTHYNEVSHDGRTVYTATRSTGQIEEGPVGFSVTNIDAGVVSWRFVELGKLPVVIITSPADVRLIADDAELDSSSSTQIRVRAKVWAVR
jgi:predicted phosphodiesterase